VKLVGSLRWFGKNDLVDLRSINQGGAHEVVTSLHEKKIGEIWNLNEIQALQQEIQKEGLGWTVVESLPVHEDIKKGHPDKDQWIDHYMVSLKNLAKAGIKVICYNFMPLLDWVRTDLTYPADRHRDALAFDWIKLAYFDIYILKRPGAEDAYQYRWVEGAEKLRRTITEAEQKNLIDNLLLGTQSFVNGPMGELDPDNVVKEFQKYLDTYQGIDAAQLRQNFKYFLDCVIPEAESNGIYMAVHPDDPPFSIFGLPRIVSTMDDYQWLRNTNSSLHNGVTFCTGSLGARKENDLSAMVKLLIDRIHFLHLRFTSWYDSGFYEDDHLADPQTLKDIINTLKDVNSNNLVFRPDHGQRMLHDFDHPYHPGYPLLGRLKGLHEINGFIQALELDH
jgi:mannonate dehydratase